MKKANKSFAKGEYEPAIEEYQKALAKGESPAEANFMIAEAYRLSNRLAKAEPFYQASIDNGTTEEAAHYYYAFALKANGKYEAAQQQLEKYVANRDSRNPEYKARAKQEVENLKKVDGIMSEKTYYTLSNMENINSAGVEYGPTMLSPNEMIITSSRGDGETYKATGTKMTSLFKVSLSSDSATAANAVSILNKEFGEDDQNVGTATISKDGKMIVFAKGNDGSKKGTKDVNLYVSRMVNDQWSEPEMLPISDPNSWDSTPTFSGDGQTLYFASNREGGKGGIDLYRATLDRNGRWRDVRNMGATLNTGGDEMFPHVSDDGKLYFASNGHPGLGGLDVFVAARDSAGNVQVNNLGTPMNSVSDDFGISFISETEGYISSDREGGMGNDDIWHFINETPDMRTATYFVNAKVMKMGANAPLSGVLVKVIDNRNDSTVLESTTGADGTFDFPVTMGRNYTVTGEKEDYFTKRDMFTTSGKAVPQEQLPEIENDIFLDYTLTLDEIVLDKAIEVPNIYYDLDKSNIRPDAAVELDKLVILLKDNPEIKIELSSHTDVRGDDAYNQKLSQRRAESAVDYIVNNGIDRSRITARGYGETQLKVENAETEEEHQENRRTEFKVTEYNK